MVAINGNLMTPERATIEGAAATRSPCERGIARVCLPFYLCLAAFPVPDSPTDCGEPVTLSKIIRLPLCGVVSDGLKVTDALQLLPGMSVSSHSDVTVNTGHVVTFI